jgi:hypothetical protein
MPFYFDGDVSGQGAADLVGGSRVLYVAVHLSALGDQVHGTGDTVTDHILKAGFVSLGDHFSIGVELPHDWWRAPIWFDWEDTLWTPIPSADAAGGALSVQATRVRWYLSPGTAGHLSVFGV